MKPIAIYQLCNNDYGQRGWLRTTTRPERRLKAGYGYFTEVVSRVGEVLPERLIDDYRATRPLSVMRYWIQPGQLEGWDERPRSSKGV